MGMTPGSSDGKVDISEATIPFIVTVSDLGEYKTTHYKNSDPVHVFEAKSAIYWHKLINRGGTMTEKELVRIIRATEVITGNRYLPDDFEYRSQSDELVLYSAITAMFDQMLLVSTRELVLPESFIKWITVASSLIPVGRFAWIGQMKKGLNLIEAFRRGLLPAFLTEHLSSGLDWKIVYQWKNPIPTDHKN